MGAMRGFISKDRHARRGRWALACIVMAATVIAPSACKAQAQPAFEVASVKLSTSQDFTSISPYPANMFIARRATLKLLIGLAWNTDRILGGPSWLDAQRYDVEAKVEGNAELTWKQMQPLLQQLLKARFHLKTHRETKIVQGYALVVTKGGPKLEASKTAQHSYAQIVRNGLQGWAETTGNLASMLASPTGRPVVDKTGLEGEYNFKLDYAPLDDPNSTLPSVFTALQQQLGLKLESQKVPVEMLVIDQVDRIPTAN